MYIKKNGLDVPRSTIAQYRFGRKLSIKNAKPGDLVFFKIHGRRLSHVGIYIGNNSFIHSPRTGKRVCIDDMTKRYWKKRYAGIASFFKA